MLSYDELLQRTDAPPGSSWGLFGDDDELGTLNFISPETVTRAASLVRRGAVFNLDIAADAFDPSVTHRGAPTHTIFSNAPYHRDDYVDNFYLQASSQIDGLRHFSHPAHGFYNGVPDEDIAVGSPTLGINRIAERGVVGRGVLIDIADHLAATGAPLDHANAAPFTVDDIEAAAARQGVRFEAGDILLLRTGWLEYALGLDDESRADMRRSPWSIGLAQSTDSLRWLWDQRIALVASDNLGVEHLPTDPASPFRADPSMASLTGHHAGMMHPVLIGLLGMPIGEMWALDHLAADCRADGVWEFLLTSHPLNITGGVGSPANALAIK